MTIHVAVQPATNEVLIRLPADPLDASSWIEYQLLHEINAGISEDVWRPAYAYLCSRTGDVFTRQYGGSPITTSGQWDVAIQETAQPDFVGGLHGYEVLTVAALSVDTIARPLGASWSGNSTWARFTQTSTLYRTLTATPIATRALTIDYTVGAMRTQQTVTWAVATNVTNSYLAMLPILRSIGSDAITDLACRDDRGYAPEDVWTSGFSMYMTQPRIMRIWSRRSGLWAQISLQTWTAYANRFAFVTNSPIYNKLYFDATGSKAVGLAEVWTIDYNTRIMSRVPEGV